MSGAVRMIVLALTSALCAGGCDWQPSSTSPTRPAGIVWTGNNGPSAVAWANACVVTVPATDLILAITSTSSSVFLDSVTVHLNDGTNLGGPSVTFPRTGLDAQFGTTLVSAGSTRAFTFGSALTCKGVQSARTDAIVVDMAGQRHSISALVQFH